MAYKKTEVVKDFECLTGKIDVFIVSLSISVLPYMCDSSAIQDTTAEAEVHLMVFP